ncbi:DUF427 domain-containing protein [Halomonas eurihalina]|uniref:DUF427 domain-containing protein n=1 Tax=Halomonas eurihalina TaxID=42566 RepID=A0A5D9D7F2_HALER|nr:DUF427 domain-containing protein [Halomonas eurihalina]MDR5859933.1 DUF427 domain-containing protein [Halomonas eurihalina]TZG39884.1 DUF427 domain-containing protein [Halomonas eurihalina]
MANHAAGSRITLHPHTRRVRIYHRDILLADTRDGIELREKGYPHRQYLPQFDVDMSKLTVSTTVTHCPFKGDSTYYSLPDIADVAWSYEHPIDETAAIAGRLAFESCDCPRLFLLGGVKFYDQS